MTSRATNRFSPEVRERAVRMVLEHEARHPSCWATTLSIAAKNGCTRQTLNDWGKRAKPDTGRRPSEAAGPGQPDAALIPKRTRMFEENLRDQVLHKVCRQLKRKGPGLARCTVTRLMRGMGRPCVIRGKQVRTTISDKAAQCPLNHVNRQFKALRPIVPWVSDFTSIATGSGFVCVVFNIDAYARPSARRSNRWRARASAAVGACRGRGKSSLVLDALEQALHERRPLHPGGVVHPEDRAATTSLSAIPTALRRPVSSRQSAASATATTTPWLRASTASTRPGSFTRAAHGSRWMSWNLPPLNGRAGLPTGGS
jgi:transposase InsO family protein